MYCINTLMQCQSVCQSYSRSSEGWLCLHSQESFHSASRSSTLFILTDKRAEAGSCQPVAQPVREDQQQICDVDRGTQG